LLLLTTAACIYLNPPVRVELPRDYCAYNNDTLLRIDDDGLPWPWVPERPVVVNGELIWPANCTALQKCVFERMQPWWPGAYFVDRPWSPALLHGKTQWDRLEGWDSLAGSLLCSSEGFVWSGRELYSVPSDGADVCFYRREAPALLVRISKIDGDDVGAPEPVPADAFSVSGVTAWPDDCSAAVRCMYDMSQAGWAGADSFDRSHDDANYMESAMRADGKRICWLQRPGRFIAWTGQQLVAAHELLGDGPDQRDGKPPLMVACGDDQLRCVAHYYVCTPDSTSVFNMQVTHTLIFGCDDDELTLRSIIDALEPGTTLIRWTVRG
jgi:hypothetical protein